jgi:hypothetical protein
MSGAEEKARVAMIEFLKSGELKPPHAVTTAPEGTEKNAGFITPNFAEGALLLKDNGGRHFRLEWPKEERDGPKGKAADRRRALAEGSYTLTGYRLVQRDAKGVEWFISASAPNLRRLSVLSGKVLPIEIDEQIHLTCRVQTAKGRLQIQVGVAGEHKSGLSIYRDGRRIDLGYRLSDATGKELAAGTLDYG